MKYKRVAPIGDEGGQGEVWRAVDEDGVEVAVNYVKLPVAIADVGNELKRFEREIRCQISLDHPNIVKVIATNLTARKPFFVMPLASGSLRGLLKYHPTGMPEQDAIDMLTTVLEAVAFAHRNGVVHRDIKPENILIFGDQPAIADFGLGRRLQSGSATITVANVGLGTIQYAAPEQLLDGHNSDTRSDVYSLGRVMYEVFTGKSPFPRADLQLVPPRFRHIVFKATRDDPFDRYVSVAAMLREFRIVANGLETFRTPTFRAKPLLDVVGTEDGTQQDAAALARLLIEHSDDDDLMGDFVLKCTGQMLEAIGNSSIDEFEQVVMALDRYADAQFDFDFVDSVANALAFAFDSTDQVELRTAILRRVMILGHSHNRYHIANVFCDLVVRVVNEPIFVPIIAELLHDDPEAKEFLRYSLSKKSLPFLIAHELAA